MTSFGKLLQRLMSKPRDFKWKELERVLSSLGFVKIEGAGPRVKFYNEEKELFIMLHRPHPSPILKAYQIHDVLETLKDGGLL